MPDELDDELLITGPPEVDDDGNLVTPPEEKQQFVPLEAFTELKTTLEALTETLNKRHEPVAPQREIEEDNRTPLQIAQKEAEDQGIFAESWVYSRAMEIQESKSEARLKALEERIVGAVGGMVMPDKLDRAISKLSGGDDDVAAEIKRMAEKGIIDYQGFQNEDVAETVKLAAERKVALNRESGIASGAAPRGNGNGPILQGLRARLDKDQLADLKIAEAKWGKFDDNDIQEAYFNARRN